MIDAPDRHQAKFRFLLAPVAQLDRVPGYEPGGREFESLRAHHATKKPAIIRWLFCLRQLQCGASGCLAGVEELQMPSMHRTHIRNQLL